MKRTEFIRTGLAAIAGLSLSPVFSWTENMQDYTLDQLLGKGNTDISGDTYTSTMHRETRDALHKMTKEAAIAGINIEVVSAYRSFQRQKEIFEGKYKRFTGQGQSPKQALENIIEYSTIPGTSRHHWGTDLDLIDAVASRPENVLNAEHFHGEGPFCKFREWMWENAARFGFYEVYTDDINRKGFKYEPWHFSYAPVSKPMLQAYRKIDIGSLLREENILGSEHFTDEFIRRYIDQNIMDINPILL